MPLFAVILLVLAGIVALFAVVIASRPADFRITRSATMLAQPASVFAQVNDFHKWQAWSPWEKIDPQLQRTYAGSSEGTGAVYSWAGNKKVGEGRMTIIESRPSERVKINLEFLKPFKATNTTEFTFQPQDGRTVMTWNMTGRHNFMSKAFCLFMNMDKMVGADFERGLANLKSLVEKA